MGSGGLLASQPCGLRICQMTEKEMAREVGRILSMSDADVEAEIGARGESQKAIADHMRDIAEAAYFRSKKRLH